MRHAIQFRALMPQDVRIPYAEFTKLLSQFLALPPSTAELQDTVELEDFGVAIRNEDFQNDEHIADFVRRVCTWGKYSAIFNRVMKQNSIGHLRDRFRTACEHLTDDALNVVDALHSVNEIHQLGQVSFASKHLRFLCPKHCPVLDSIISSRMFIPPTDRGYRDFAVQCAELAANLTAHQIHHPVAQRGGIWFAADVEAAIYRFLRDNEK